MISTHADAIVLLSQHGSAEADSRLRNHRYRKVCLISRERIEERLTISPRQQHQTNARRRTLQPSPHYFQQRDCRDVTANEPNRTLDSRKLSGSAFEERL